MLCPPWWRPRADADFALAHVTPGAPIRAFASGIVRSQSDRQGRSSIVLTADNGTRYWYADVGCVEVPDGSRVVAGQIIGRTVPNAPELPSTSGPGSLPPGGPPPGPPGLPPAGGEVPEPPPSSKRPAQIVFVEEPPAPPEPTLVPEEPQGLATVPPAPIQQRSQFGNTMLALAVAVGAIGIVYAIAKAVSKPRPVPALPAPTPKKKRAKRARRKTRRSS
jgi:Peptidase family M23